MPKVTEEHREQMKQRILKAAESACAERPAYDVTMRDVIRKAELSPGAVYSYYGDIDSLWVDYLNSGVADEQKAEPARLGRKPEEGLEAYVDRILDTAGEYLRKMPVRAGKIIFELETKRATHPEFAQKRREGTKMVLHYHAMVDTLRENIQRDAEAGKIHPAAEPESITLFLQAAFDGILRNIILERCYGLKKEAPMDEKKLMAALALSIKALLQPNGPQEKE